MQIKLGSGQIKNPAQERHVDVKLVPEAILKGSTKPNTISDKVEPSGVSVSSEKKNSK